MYRHLISILSILICTSAYASSVSVQGGLAHTSNSNYDDGASVVVRGETTLIGDLSGGVEYGYHSPQDHSPYGSFEGHSVLGELLWYPSVEWKVKPYALAGLGWSWWNFNRGQDTIDRGINVELGDAFCQKYGIGADYPLNDKWAIGIEWSYFHAAVPKRSFYADGSSSAILGDDDRSGEVKVGQEEFQLVAGVKYRF